MAELPRQSNILRDMWLAARRGGDFPELQFIAVMCLLAVGCATVVLVLSVIVLVLVIVR